MTALTPTNPMTREIFGCYVMLQMSIFAFILSTVQEVTNAFETSTVDFIHEKKP
jgi:hypothetical protein